MSKTLTIVMTFLACTALVPFPAGAATTQLFQTGQTTCYDTAGVAVPCVQSGAGGIDLALQPGSLVANPANPAPGSTVTLTVTALNLGDQVLTDIPLEFVQIFEGETHFGALIIGETTIAGPFNPGDSQTVSVDCTLPPFSGSDPWNYSQWISAVIDPWSVYDTLNRGNNSLALTTMLPDLVVTRLDWTRTNPAFVTVTARLSNTGVITSQATHVTLHLDAPTGPTLGSQDLSVLEPGQSMDIEFPDVKTGPVNQPRKVFAVADEINVVLEFDEANNTEWVEVYQAGHFPTPLGSSLSTSFSGESVVDAVGIQGATRIGAAGDEIAVFDADGTLCGHGLVQEGGSYTLIVYGDDPATTEIDEGAIPGEALTFRVWDGQRQAELPVRTLQPNGQRQSVTWTADGSDAVNLHGLAQDRTGVSRSGQWYLDSNDSGAWEPVDLQISYGSAADIPLFGDWDGDGTATPGIKRGNIYYLRNSNTSGVADLSFVYGGPDDMPLVGDWDGDGTDTIGIKRGNAYHLRNSNTSGVADLSFIYGGPDDTPVVGDWDGDGTDSIGIKRGNTYYLRNSNSSGVADIDFTYGGSIDMPVAGDWDGDGSDSIGVYRSAEGAFYLRNSNTSGIADTVLSFGLAEGTPFFGKW